MAKVEFPIQKQLNFERDDLFDMSHDPSCTIYQKVGAWFGHKALTVISIPTNLLGLGLATTGAAVTACTLGAFKVAVFALTLGNVVLEFPIGFKWCMECALNSTLGITTNVAQIIYDTVDVLWQVAQKVRWVAQKIHLEPLLIKVANKIGDGIEFVYNRFEKGFTKAADREEFVDFDLEVPFPLEPLNDLTADYRIQLGEERSFKEIFIHTGLSLVNIPLNGVAAACSAIATVILAGGFMAKTTLYALTGLDIPVPTYVGRVTQIALATGANALIDSAVDVGDVFISLYNISEAVGLVKVAATVAGLVLYIPLAVFT